MRVLDDGGAVLLHPAAAEGIIHEVRRVAAEEREVGEGWTLAEEVGAASQMRTEDPHPRAQHILDPELDRAGGHPERRTAAPHVRADRGVGLIARDGHLHGDVAGALEAAE